MVGRKWQSKELDMIVQLEEGTIIKQVCQNGDDEDKKEESSK